MVKLYSVSLADAERLLLRLPLVRALAEPHISRGETDRAGRRGLGAPGAEVGRDRRWATARSRVRW